MSGLLSFDVIVEILSCLPVKTLKRLRCVSKELCSLIDSGYFEDLNLSRSIRNNNNAMLVLMSQYYKKRKGKLYWPPRYPDFYSFLHVDCYSLDQDIKGNLTQIKVGSCPLRGLPGFDLTENFTRPFGDFVNDCVGCSNGVLCLSTKGRGLDLVNPLLTEECHHGYPSAAAIETGGDDTSYFYYDAPTHDFKLAILRSETILSETGKCPYHRWDERWDERLEVYRLEGDNGFRMIQSYPLLDFDCNPGYNDTRPLFHSGALYWVGKTDWRPTKIIAFNLERRVDDDQARCDKFGLPCQENYGGRWRWGALGVLDGCLTATSYYGYGEEWEIWVMKEYGVQDSWTKLLRCETAKFSEISCPSPLRPLAYSKKGNKVLLERESCSWFHTTQLFWYDLERKTVAEVKIPGAPEHFKVAVCVASLVNYKGTTRN
ncbi:hypothetical protein Tsubulata_020205 [Turnera subulata]|uniref:F-box domain-containing protein n=1 Tax=Turnera subulata TaxID=218843 RepID=A0A9Q0FQC3_9ROSI|nr:hypothetical protein Tsubulata_020205 [Turnera subulata]